MRNVVSGKNSEARVNLRSIPRPDWFVWNDPDPVWVRQHADLPGLQFGGDGARVTLVTLHRSHLPLLPAGVHLPISFEARFAGATPVDESVILRSYQAEDLPFLITRRGSLLAYEMRLGKTLTACCVHDPHSGMLVVVGPLASRDVWRTWIERVHGSPPLVLQGVKDPEPMPGFPAYFVHYDILDAHTRFFAGERIGTLILDECHLLQSRRAKRTNAVTVLATRAERIIGLSGTPMWARPDSLFSILQLITPGAWGGHHAFGVRWANGQPGAHGWSYSGVSNEDEFRLRLSEVMVRRTWKDVAPHLPPTTRIIEPVDVSSSELAQIEAAAVRASLAHGTTTTVGYLATLRRMLADVKIKTAVDSALAAVLDGHKVVVWCWHREVADKVAVALAKTQQQLVFRLRADDDASERERQVENFRASAGASIMVAGITVGGVAIDLSCSDYAIFCEMDWIPANLQQAEMRTFHPSRPHVVVYLYADVPVESKLVTALGIKEGFASSLGLGFDEIAAAVFS